jgi:hypothetical protein
MKEIYCDGASIPNAGETACAVEAEPELRN